MDPISLSFYAAVCATLAYASPWLGHPVLRLALGAAVGLGASALLPWFQTAVGY